MSPEELLNVAFVISEETNLLDVAGAWEVFRDTRTGPYRGDPSAFRLFTVSDGPDPVTATGGLVIEPRFTVDDAPVPAIICVGAQRGSPELRDWIRARSGDAEVTMSVCTGAFELGRAGVLSGRRATTHHAYWDEFEEEFEDVTLVRGPRFIDEGRVVTAGGLTAGIDSALHVVARIKGVSAAERAARYMEYRGAE